MVHGSCGCISIIRAAISPEVSDANPLACTGVESGAQCLSAAPINLKRLPCEFARLNRGEPDRHRPIVTDSNAADIARRSGRAAVMTWGPLGLARADTRPRWLPSLAGLVAPPPHEPAGAGIHVAIRQASSPPPMWRAESYWHVQSTGKREADLRLGRKY